MSRPKKLIPSYRHHRASGQAMVVLNGQAHYLGPHGTQASKREYDRLLAEWLVRGREPVADDGMTLNQLMSRYLKFAEQRYRKQGQPSSELTAIKIALRFVRDLYGATRAANFGPIAAKAVRLKMIEAGLARTTINQHVGRIRRMLRWAVSEQLIPAHVHQQVVALEGLRKGRGEARETDPVLPVDDAHVDATLPHLPAVVGDMVKLQRLTGMRPTEVCIIRPCDIDRRDEIWVYTPEEHKTEHFGISRKVFLGPQAQDILLRYMAREESSFCFQPRDSEANRRADQHARRKTPLIAFH